MINVGFFIYDAMEILDYIGPHTVFYDVNKYMEKSPFNLLVFSSGKGKVRAQSGVEVMSDYSFDDIKDLALDVLVIPGGKGARKLIYHQESIDFIKDKYESSRFVLSVCTGALILAKTGVLKNKTVTTHRDGYEMIKELDKSITIDEDRMVVSQGNLFMTAGVCTGIKGALEVIKCYVEPKIADKVRKNLYYGPEFCVENI